ncbi:hypothetical protein SAMN06893096_112105 [Geodermatophilus pulveris]|uniref:Uncharacterized protein n=1 Tax=Geodermatophilus pulveris TaxID=1564159 RepID=A0A239J2L1_9ACTN|nr:hypothetical protein [Geodermatophilus pulveris]SNT00050.1 hypothetical protein SAMN06893096_112105 [Geodermatophilus pulveris]
MHRDDVATAGTSTGPVLGNLDPALETAWHPVAPSGELRPGGWLQVRLLGRTWTLHRTDRLAADPPAHGVRERLGVVWLAPGEPRDVPLEVAEDGDRRFVTGRLRSRRSAAAAGVVADALLDAAHARSGAVPPAAVSPEPGGSRSVRGDRAAGRRLTSVHRAPFQLLLREESRDAGAVRTLLLLLQPEDADSTRVHPRLLLSAGSGRPLPAPADVAREVAAAQRVLDEDLAAVAHLAGTGLALAGRDGPPVPADRPGAELRRALCEFVLSAPVRHRGAA